MKSHVVYNFSCLNPFKPLLKIAVVAFAKKIIVSVSETVTCIPQIANRKGHIAYRIATFR